MSLTPFAFQQWDFIFAYILTNICSLISLPGICTNIGVEEIFFLKILFIYFQREGKGVRKRRRETSVCEGLSIASHKSLNRGPGPNPGMCPHWESNQRPFSSQAGTQFTEPHQPGLELGRFFIGYRINFYRQKLYYHLCT